MSQQLQRRSFLGLAVTGLAGAQLNLHPRRRSMLPELSSTFPRQDAGMVEEMLKVSHGGLARVKQLLDTHPALVALDAGAISGMLGTSPFSRLAPSRSASVLRCRTAGRRACRSSIRT